MPSERFTQAVEAYVKELGGVAKYHARRLRCQTDLWFLSKEIFGRDLFERTHRPVVDFFLKKKPFTPAFRKDSKYGLADFQAAIAELAPLAIRKGICLYPRGNYKSSLDEDDITQYVINYPDIRILIMVGESSLGEAFVPNIKQRFILERDREPTEFQRLFPEFVIDLESDKDRGGAQEYWSPARRLIQKEPTIGSISILGSTSGWHCDVLKCDDVITDTTPVETSMARNKIVRKFVTTANLLDPHGVLELIGTRYHEEDLYEHVKTNLKDSRYLCGASWTVLPHARLKKPEIWRSRMSFCFFPKGRDSRFSEKSFFWMSKLSSCNSLMLPNYSVLLLSSGWKIYERRPLAFRRISLLNAITFGTWRPLTRKEATIPQEASSPLTRSVGLLTCTSSSLTSSRLRNSLIK